MGHNEKDPNKRSPKEQELLIGAGHLSADMLNKAEIDLIFDVFKKNGVTKKTVEEGGKDISIDDVAAQTNIPKERLERAAKAGIKELANWKKEFPGRDF